MARKLSITVWLTYILFFNIFQLYIELTGAFDRDWTDARRPVPRLWIRFAEVRGERR